MASSESEYDGYSEEASDSEYSDEEDDSDSQYSQEDGGDDGEEYEDDDEEEEEDDDDYEEYEEEEEDDEDDDEYYDEEEEDEEVEESGQLGEDEFGSDRDADALRSLEYSNDIENVNLQKDPDEISELNDGPFSGESTPSDADVASAERENLQPKQQQLSPRAGNVNADRDNAADSVLAGNMGKMNISDTQATVS